MRQVISRKTKNKASYEAGKIKSPSSQLSGIMLQGKYILEYGSSECEMQKGVVREGKYSNVTGAGAAVATVKNI